jgi:hypothetical protein
MRDDAIRQRLRERNPWWRAPSDPLSWSEIDETLREAEMHDLGYRPGVLDDVAPDGLFLLRGPRRVGKSVALKRLIVALLKRLGAKTRRAPRGAELSSELHSRTTQVDPAGTAPASESVSEGVSPSAAGGEDLTGGVTVGRPPPRQVLLRSRPSAERRCVGARIAGRRR